LSGAVTALYVDILIIAQGMRLGTLYLAGLQIACISPHIRRLRRAESPAVQRRILTLIR